MLGDYKSLGHYLHETDPYSLACTGCGSNFTVNPYGKVKRLTFHCGTCENAPSVDLVQLPVNKKQKKNNMLGKGEEQTE